jgi:hypothetical protein
MGGPGSLAPVPPKKPNTNRKEIDMRVQGLALVALVAMSASALAQNTYPTNPAGFYYKSTFENIETYKQPSALIIAHECNRYDPTFADARARGAEVLAYINVVERQANPESVCSNGNYAALYKMPPGFPTGDYAPFWPWPTYQARTNYVGQSYTTYLLDIRAGQPWPDKIVAFVEDLMKKDQFDGVFLDVLGARLWTPQADWTNTISPGVLDWTDTERNAWTEGAVDIVRRLDASRQRLNPKFIIVNNNSWAGADGGHGRDGEHYVDGIAIEHHASTETPQTGYANLQTYRTEHRRVVIIANDPADELEWRKKPGVTHVTSQPAYDFAPPPTQPAPPTKTFTRLTDRLRAFGDITESPVWSDGMTANKKRASKFTMSENGTLLALWAYLDGNGGVASGTQSVRMAVYADNAGAPGRKIAESETKWFAPGAPAGWRNFKVVDQTIAVPPGNYWIAIHTGDTQGIVRNYGDGVGSWISNVDDFSNGADDPFGNDATTITGATTLSVYATYRVVQ